MLWRLLREYVRPYRRELAFVLALQLVATLAALYLPALNADIIDNGVVVGDTSYIVRVGVVMLGFSLVQVGATIVAVYFGSRTAMGVGRDLRSDIFGSVGDFSSREVSQFGAPSLITRNTNDVQQIQTMTAVGLTLVVTAPIMMVGGIIMALREDVGLSWLVAVAVPVLGASIALIATRLIPAFRRMQKKVDEVNRVLREQATGIRVLRAFVREPFETDRFDRANTELTDVSLTVGRWMAAMFPIVILILNVSSVAVLWFGGLRIEAGLMQIGSLTAFLTYLLQILMSVMMATLMFVMVPRAAVSADRIGEILDTEPSVRPPAAGISRLVMRGHLTLDDVTFSYPGADHPVLSDV
ncbi:MAG TPA: ABC transporter permease, partial [Acidimicrobiia bacterium]|nr:ABC transporter permease [Acidimicrobiia bacterium]